jgi:drug/metabolite transporter (DMT)-like permease
MKRGLAIAVGASLAFGTTGAFIKPLLEAGWSPAAAVAFRALAAAMLLMPLALASLRGRWTTLWRGRWRILGMGVIGVVGCQLVYFMAVARIPVGTAILIEYLAPVLLVLFAWATTRKVPRPVVLIGAVVAVAGLVLVIGPAAFASVDMLGVLFAFLSAIGAAAYFLIAARPSDGLPGVALAWSGLLLGSLVLFALGGLGILPFSLAFTDVAVLGSSAPWWVPLGIVALFGTAIGYGASITATGLLGSRLMSFVALLEVVFATMFAWLVLGESLSLPQFFGGALILVGIVLVYSERRGPEPLPTVETLPSAEPVAVRP